MPTIITKVETKRLCNYRKPGGKYFVSDGIGSPCGKLPAELHVCPTCSGGVKQSRGYTWINSFLFSGTKCTSDKKECKTCPMNIPNMQMGLMWVGSQFYPTTHAFNKEASRIGISKRISQIPNDFQVGKTFIALAHPKAVTKYDEKNVATYHPGVFRVFRPDRIEYVITGNETEEELVKLEKRGFTLVQIVRDTEAQLPIHDSFLTT